MKFLQYLKVIFVILSCVVLSFLLPIAFAIAYNEMSMIPAFVLPMLPVLLIAGILLFVTRKRQLRLSTHGGIALVACVWIFASVIGALPFFISGVIPKFVDALFETASGFTTTGATIMTVIEGQPISMLVWRAQTHWLGGMGIVVLAVALFPLLGVGGFALIKSETTGPDKGKVTSKIAETAKALWIVYCVLTILPMIALMCAGMNFTEALCHAFSILGTGGFSTRNSSIGSFNSGAINIICTVFMFLASWNFSLYIRLLQGHPEDIWQNSELHAFLKIFFASGIIIAILITPMYGLLDAFNHSFFQVASVMSTTGLSSTNFDLWPEAAKFVLLLLFFIGGCSGSTAGGIKVIRWVILKKQAGNEIKRLLYPHGVFSIQLNGRPGRKDVVYSVAGFVFLYLFLVGVTAFVAVNAGVNVYSAIVSALSLVGNVGAGFDMIGPTQNFAFFSGWAKFIFTFMMLAGRLELYTMLVFFSKEFWRK